MHVFSPFFMTSPLNCPSLFWGILNSAYRPKFGWNLNPKVLEKKLVKNDQCIFTNLILLLSPLSKARGPSYDQTWSKFGTKYPCAYELMKDALVGLWRIGMVRSHYILHPLPFKTTWFFIWTTYFFLNP